jgi:hypothetical protein
MPGDEAQVDFGTGAPVVRPEGNGLTHAEFLELVLQDELLVRKERQIKRRVKAAMFRELR